MVLRPTKVNPSINNFHVCAFCRIATLISLVYYGYDRHYHDYDYRYHGYYSYGQDNDYIVLGMRIHKMVEAARNTVVLDTGQVQYTDTAASHTGLGKTESLTYR